MVDWARDSELLRARRGAFDGSRFFSRSPFRSKLFLCATGMGAAAIGTTAYFVYIERSRLRSVEIEFLALFAFQIFVLWSQSLRRFGRIRSLFLDGSIKGVVSAGCGAKHCCGGDKRVVIPF